MARKMSAAAVRRLRDQIKAEREAEPTPLPSDFVPWLHSEYRPQPALQPLWPMPLLPFVEETLLLSAIRGTDSLRKHATHLGYYGAWRSQRKLSLDPRTAMNRGDVDEYTRTGMPGSSDKSRSDRRSRLRALCDTLNPDAAPHRSAVVIPRQSIKPPYADLQMKVLADAIQVQPTDELVRQLCISFGLGAGAGVDSPELKLLDTTHVVDGGDDGIRIDIPGPRARQVWVLREYEHLVRRGLRNLPAGRPLIGRVKTRRNVAAAVYADAVLLGSLPKLDQSRLRVTWLATLMRRPVPLGVILAAAGLKSTRTLFDLLPHITTDVITAEALRDGGAQ